MISRAVLYKKKSSRSYINRSPRSKKVRAT